MNGFTCGEGDGRVSGDGHGDGHARRLGRGFNTSVDLFADGGAQVAEGVEVEIFLGRTCVGRLLGEWLRIEVSHRLGELIIGRRMGVVCPVRLDHGSDAIEVVIRRGAAHGGGNGDNDVLVVVIVRVEGRCEVLTNVAQGNAVGLRCPGHEDGFVLVRCADLDAERHAARTGLHQCDLGEVGNLGGWQSNQRAGELRRINEAIDDLAELGAIEEEELASLVAAEVSE